MAKRGLLLGLDAGTQSVKAALYDLGGSPRGTAARPLEVSSPHPGWAEQEPETWWSAAAAAIRDCRSAAGSQEVLALGVAWQRETFVLEDAQGRALRPAMLWLDVRAQEEAAHLGPDAARLHELTGVPPDVTTVVPRMAWLRAHEPEVVAGARTWRDVGAWLLGRLTGAQATCAAGADTTGLVSLSRVAWCDEAVEHAGLGRVRLPDLVEPGEVVGGLLPEAAKVLGLSPGLPVVAAGGDGQVAASAACRDPGTALTLSLGTSVVLGLPAAGTPVAPYFRTLRAAWPGEGRLLEAVLQSGTYLLRWLVERLAPGGASLEDLDRAAQGLPAGAEGLVTVPHWWGSRFPRPAPDARGATLGWTDRHTGAHLFRSLLEGSAFEIRYLAERMAAEVGARDGSIRVGGGGARSELWLQILRDVLGRPLALSGPEPVAAGAAVLAALGAGLVRDPASLAAVIDAPRRLPAGDRGSQARYEGLYRDVWLPCRELSVDLGGRLGRWDRGEH